MQQIHTMACGGPCFLWAHTHTSGRKQARVYMVPIKRSAGCTVKITMKSKW